MDDFTKHVLQACRADGPEDSEGDWQPTAVVQIKGHTVGIKLDWFMLDNEATKDALAEALAQMVKMVHIEKMAVVIPAWIVRQEMDEPIDDIPPSEHPKKEEIVGVSVMDGGQNDYWVANVIRSGGAPTLAPFKKVDGMIFGRFPEKIMPALAEVNGVSPEG